MAIRMPRIIHSKNFLRRSSSIGNQTTLDIPKGHVAVYVGEGEKKRFTVPIAYLNQHLFQDLLRQAEDEFGFDHPIQWVASQSPVAWMYSSMSRLN